MIRANGAKANYCTAVDCYSNGFTTINVAGAVLTNCDAYGCTLDYRYVTGVAGSNNADQDGTAPGASSQTLTVAERELWEDNTGTAYDGGEDKRVLSTSSLAGNGVAIGGITTDCDENTRDVTNPTIGWHEGTAAAFALVPAANYTNPGAGAVAVGNDFQFEGVTVVATRVDAIANNVTTVNPNYADPGAPKIPAYVPFLLADILSQASGGTAGGIGGLVYGTLTPDYPAVRNVLVRDTVQGNAGEFVVLAEAFAKLAETWGYKNEFKGSYDPTGTPPTTPVLVSEDDEDGDSITLTVTCDAASTCTAYVWVSNDWVVTEFVGGSAAIWVADGAAEEKNIVASTGWSVFMVKSVSAAGQSCNVTHLQVINAAIDTTYWRVVEIKKKPGAQTKDLKLEKYKRPTYPL